MTEREFVSEHVTAALSGLATHEPDRNRAARVRARCHAALQRQEPLGATGTPRVGWRRILEPAIVGSLCAGYLYEVLSRALQLYRF